MLTDQFFLSMFRTSQTLMRNGINFRITTLRNESLVTRARNILTAMFLESDCTHLMFIDADIEFSDESVLRALAYDKPIMAAAYPKKALPIQYAINFKFVDQNTKQIRVENGAVEVLDASTGFFLIKREVIEKMMQSIQNYITRMTQTLTRSLTNTVTHYLILYMIQMIIDIYQKIILSVVDGKRLGRNLA